MIFFKPKQRDFFEIFESVGAITVQIAELLNMSFKDFSNFDQAALQAEDLEHKADVKTHEAITYLNTTFVTPYDREDIYMLAHELDDIVDLIESTMQKIKLYHIQAPENYYLKFSNLVLQGAQVLENLIFCLAEQKHSQKMVDLVIKMHELEDQGDIIYRASLEELFINQKDPIEIIKQKEILENLESVIDRFQSASDKIEGVIVKSS